MTTSILIIARFRGPGDSPPLPRPPVPKPVETECINEALPADLVGRILTFLIPVNVVRCKRVCRKWDELISSSEWRCLYGQANPSLVCMIMSPLIGNPISILQNHRDYEAFFCPVRKRWHRLPPKPRVCPNFDWELCDTDGPLVAYRYRSPNGTLWICVGNPLTQSYRVLPPFCHHSPDEGLPGTESEALQLITNRETKSFKVIVVIANNLSTTVYDSISSTWIQHESVPPINFTPGQHRLLWKNIIYFPCFEPNLLAAFDLKSGIWTEIRTTLPCTYGFSFLLFKQDDNIYLVGRTVFEDAEEDNGTTAWMLREDSSGTSSSSPFEKATWMKLSINIPAKISRILDKPQAAHLLLTESFDRHTILHLKDSICFANNTIGNDWLTYNVDTKEWQIMPVRGSKHSSYEWFTWEPSMDFEVSTFGSS